VRNDDNKHANTIGTSTATSILKERAFDRNSICGGGGSGLATTTIFTPLSEMENRTSDFNDMKENIVGKCPENDVDNLRQIILKQ
jgi:hypothetical protein